MPLRHFANARKIPPSTREKHECVVGLRKKLSSSPKSFEKILRIIDGCIDQLVEAKTNNAVGLVYTKTGFLLGHQSAAPHMDVEYLWAKISGTLINKLPTVSWTEHETRMVMRTIGALVMWRMSLRDEDWLVKFTETERVDVVTQDQIKIAEYWINKR
jgi:hypothetical protein